MIDGQYESQPHWRRVYIENFSVDRFLTEAFHNPLLLRSNTAWPDYSARFSLRLSDPYQVREIIVIQQILDKSKIATFLIIILIVSPALGILVGLSSSNAEVGIAVSAGIFALASLLQGLAAWFQN